jgi:hypothetical protein
MTQSVFMRADPSQEIGRSFDDKGETVVLGDASLPDVTTLWIAPALHFLGP